MSEFARAFAKPKPPTKTAASAAREYQEPSTLQSAWDEISGAFARYGRRSGAQRDASLAMLNQAVAPGTDPLTGAGMKALGLAGLVTHPLAFFPSGDEWRERLSNAGNDSRIGQAIGGALGDLPSIVDPHLLAGGGMLAAAPLIGKMAGKVDDVADAGKAAGEGFTVYHGTGRESADEIQRGGFKIFGGRGDADQFPLEGISTTPSKSTAQYYAAGENYMSETDRLDPVVMELRVSGSKSLYPSLDKATREYEAAGGDLADSKAFLQFLKGKGYKGVREGEEIRVFDPADIQAVKTHPMQYSDDGLIDDK